jgi:hypothetical protein
VWLLAERDERRVVVAWGATGCGGSAGGVTCPGFSKGCTCPVCQALYISRYANSETYAFAPGQHAQLAGEMVDLIAEAERILEEEA